MMAADERKRALAKLVAKQEVPGWRWQPPRCAITLAFFAAPGTTDSWTGDYTLPADLVDQSAVVGKIVLVEYLGKAPEQVHVLRIVRALTSSREASGEP